MGRARAEIDLDAAPEKVWAVVGDFGSVGGWVPGLESCVVDGPDRILKLMGLEITERLERRDDDERTLTYRIVAGVPVVNHEATISVLASGSGTHVNWDVDVEPDDMTALMCSTYQQALEALKGHVGG
jgi:carbon monoxide dehydrogenase subunit G